MSLAIMATFVQRYPSIDDVVAKGSMARLNPLYTQSLYMIQRSTQSSTINVPSLLSAYTSRRLNALLYSIAVMPLTLRHFSKHIYSFLLPPNFLFPFLSPQLEQDSQNNTIFFSSLARPDGRFSIVTSSLYQSPGL